MLKELLEALSKQAVEAAAPKVLHPEAEPKHVYFLKDENNEWLPHTAEPAVRDHKALSLGTVADNAVEGSTIWYSRKAVTLLIDDATRRDRVTMPLEFSPQINVLLQLEKQKTNYSQRDFVFLLRTTFARSLGQVGNLLQIVRSVKFNVLASGEGEVQHGKSSVGKSIKQEIAGAGAIPEYVTLQVPIFTAPELQRLFPVECALEPEAANATFQLIPLPGEIEGAINAAEAVIAEYLAMFLGENVVPVYYGTA